MNYESKVPENSYKDTSRGKFLPARSQRLGSVASSPNVPAYTEYQNRECKFGNDEDIGHVKYRT
jgi:hypothetical protein